MMSKVPSVECVGGLHAKARGQHRSKAVGVPPRWGVARGWSLGTRSRSAPRSRAAPPGADAAEPGVAELVDRARCRRRAPPPRLGSGHGDRSLGDHDDRRQAAALAGGRSSRGAEGLDIEGPLGHQDLGRPPGDAGVRGDPPGVAAITSQTMIRW